VQELSEGAWNCCRKEGAVAAVNTTEKLKSGRL
jgi:hypothetical protein